MRASIIGAGMPFLFYPVLCTTYVLELMLFSLFALPLLCCAVLFRDWSARTFMKPFVCIFVDASWDCDTPQDAQRCTLVDGIQCGLNVLLLPLLPLRTQCLWLRCVVLPVCCANPGGGSIPTPSSITQHHPTPSDTTQRHQTTSNVIK